MKKGQPDLTDMRIEMRMASKQLMKEANRAQAKEKKERKKIAELIAKGKREIAQIHAETAIREHNQAISLMRLSAQMEAVEGQLRTAERMSSISATMQRCLPGLQTALSQMDKMDLGASMESFNKVFEDLGVQSIATGEALDQVAGTSVDMAEVDKMIEQVSAENGLKIAGDMGSAGTGKIGQKTDIKSSIGDMEHRLAALKQ
eukprot:TRINITY_DN934_c0_g1_i11.p1 TRINITY_DN934_c0_g1~~TRINITY_DN934_c0_g1_i11.p1  ORF type:complete len:203 (-),score=89.11 TRINITY_DN934_c0_g1_i11:223-831(-)